MRVLSLFIVGAAFSCESDGKLKPNYWEQLNIQPLSRKEVLSTFEFEMAQPLAPPDEWSLQEYTLFPRPLGQIVENSNTRELHLRFGQGWWDAESWGSLPFNGSRSGGIGVELWAWIDGSSFEEAWKNWRKLVQLLGGYFCASFNFIDATQTTFPSDSILSPKGEVKNAWLMRGTLPAEPICTENLTPFLKLLPCQSNAGIASLLDGHTLFRSSWQSMGVDVWQKDNSIHLLQTVSSVANTGRCKKDPLPWHVPSSEMKCDSSKSFANDWTCFPSFEDHSSFKISDIFGKEIQGPCLFAPANRPAVRIHAPNSWLVNESPENREFLLAGDSANEGGTLDVELKTDNNSNVQRKEKPLLYVDRSFGGWGQQNGAIRTVFTNPEPVAISVNYLENLPWFMRLYLHTMVLEGDGTLTSTRYVPCKDRERPSQLELGMHLPAGAKFEVEYSFDKSLLYIEEYPPDANHGFEVPPGLAIAQTPMGTYEVRTSSLLLSLPVPDFSMPYNVIILTSTVMALAFGTVFNLVARDVVRETDVPKRESSLALLKTKILSKF